MPYISSDLRRSSGRINRAQARLGLIGTGRMHGTGGTEYVRPRTRGELFRNVCSETLPLEMARECGNVFFYFKCAARKATETIPFECDSVSVNYMQRSRVLYYTSGRAKKHLKYRFYFETHECSIEFLLGPKSVFFQVNRLGADQNDYTINTKGVWQT